MAIRISSALVVTLALVAGCGQKPERQQAAPNLASIADDQVEYAILDYVHAKMDGRYEQEAEILAAHQHAELMREANRIHAAEQAQIEKFKEQGTLQAFSDSYKVSKLGPLDERFYKIDENLSALRVAKIRADPASFSMQ